jgi:tryptophanase
MSTIQWSALMKGDEAYAGSESFQRLEATTKRIFGFKHVIPVHQGRAGERILSAVMCNEDDVVPNNNHFDTTRANLEYRGANAVDLVIDEGLDPQSLHPFKGNMDIGKLEGLIQEVGADKIPLCMLTLTNNSGGGQPVAMANVRAVKEALKNHGIPLYFDAARFAENAYFIKIREDGYHERTVEAIVQEMMSYADGCWFSAKKDGLVNMGGMLCTNDDQIAKAMTDLLILTEGFSTYGGLSGREMECIAVGMEEVLDEAYLRYRVAVARYLGKYLMDVGFPIIQPTGGHAVYIDAGAALPHIPPLQYPAWSLSIEFYLAGGIRTSEIGSVGFGRVDPETGEETPAAMDLLRFALPRRVHTQSHIDYVIEVAKDVFARRDELRGLRIVDQAQFLRHFTAKLVPLD